MMFRQCALLAVLLFACMSCETDRYQWNLNHAEVHAKPPLPRADVEQIVRLVTHTTTSPIGSIARSPPQNGQEQVSIIAAASTGPVDEFILQKVGSEWKVGSHDQQMDR